MVSTVEPSEGFSSCRPSLALWVSVSGTNAVWLAFVLLLAGGVSALADDDVVTQKPEIAVSVVAGSEAEKAAETPRDAFHLLPGFQVERLFTVPKEEFGSWASMTIDPKGRVIAAAEGKQGLFRITPPAIGSSEPTKVERLKVDIPAAQGLLVGLRQFVRHPQRRQKRRCIGLRDTDGDDKFDDVRRLKDLFGSGDHGPHALRVSPDGKQLFLIGGNHTDRADQGRSRSAAADGGRADRSAACFAAAG